MKTLLTIVFCVILFGVTAQHKYDWAKYDSLQFKEDSVKSFINEEVQNRIIYPITESNADIELRLYIKGMTTNEGRIKIIQIYKDSVIAKNVFYKYLEHWSYKDKEEYLGKTNFNYDITRKVNDIKSPFSVNELVEYLKKSTLFFIEDKNAFITNEKKKGKTINSPKDRCETGVLCEIKVNKKVRNLYLWWDAFDFIDSNPEIEYLKYQRNILELFTTLYH